MPVWLSRTGFSGELGYELFTSPSMRRTCGASTGSAPCRTGSTWWNRSIEAGMVVTDYDYEAHERSLYDLGLDRVVALDAEGAFMGKDVLRGIAADPPNRFKTLRLEGTSSPSTGRR